MSSDIGTHGEELYRQVLPLHGPDPGELARDYIGAVSLGALEIDDLVRDTDAGPGWSVILDVDACPAKGLRWLAYVRGAVLRPQRADETLAAWAVDARERIRNQSSADRGTPGAIASAAGEVLTGAKQVRVTERVDGSGYRLGIVTRPSETPTPALVIPAATTQKAAGVRIMYAVQTDLPVVDEGLRTIDSVAAGVTIDAAVLADVT